MRWPMRWHGGGAGCGWRAVCLAGLLAAAPPVPARAETAALSVSAGPPLAAAALLRRPDLRHVDLRDTALDLARDVPVVPLSSLLPEAAQAAGLSFRASDGFVAEIAPEVFADGRRAGAQPWIAIETAPWKRRRNGDDRGPFALVWLGPGAGTVPRERWVDSLVAITPLGGPALPAATSPQAAAGRAAFSANCAPCHRLQGIGDGELGPDLGRPMNATRYLTAEGFRHIVRDPRSVRRWPGERMEGFAPAALADADVEAIWAYLKSLDGR